MVRRLGAEKSRQKVCGEVAMLKFRQSTRVAKKMHTKA